MEELAIKMAEYLEISVETAIELYPVLRSQFMVYMVLDRIGNVVFTLSVLTFIATVIIGMIMLFLYAYAWDSEEEEAVKSLGLKIFKIAGPTFVVLQVVYILIMVIGVIFAPDVVMIRSFF